jgi:Family of unknown function (DUF5367)
MVRFVWIGLVGWLIATLIVRAAGQILLPFDSLFTIVLPFVVAIPAMLVIMQLLYNWQQIDPPNRLRAAASTALPGMVLDAVIVLCFPVVFPNMPASANIPFGALMLWGYGLILLSGFFPTVRQSVELK